MSPEPSLVTSAAALAAAVAFSAIALISSDFAFAGDRPMGDAEPQEARLLDWEDREAALEALHTALAESPDGAAFVWQRWGGSLRGVIKPTSSFKVADGRVCRHVIVALAAPRKSGQIETIACRLADGAWQLDGG